MRARKAVAVDLSECDGDLVERLRAFRAAMSGGKPVYTVFSNETLACIATTPPADRDEFLAIKGLGPKRWDTFGPQLLEILAATAKG